MSEADCNHIVNPLRLVREGASQPERDLPALDPAAAPVNEHGPEHEMVFAQALAQYLRYFDDNNIPGGDWQSFFQNDVSASLALAAIQDVDWYKSRVKEYFDFLNNRENMAGANLTRQAALKDQFGALFSIAGTLAFGLDKLKESLPATWPLRGALQNLLSTQLAPGFRRLMYCHKAGTSEAVLNETAPDFRVLGNPVVPFTDIVSAGLSRDWITDASADWTTYYNLAVSDAAAYGTAAAVFPPDPELFNRINRLSTHNLFTAVFDQFLKVYARVVVDAKKSLEATFTAWDDHPAHFALFLAFLRLNEYVRAEANTLTQRHLDFYYKDILGLKQKPAEPGRAHLLVELAKHAGTHLLPANALFKAGKDAAGKEAFFQNDRDFVANRAVVTALHTLYRHDDEKVGEGALHANRLFASPVSNSEDGLGAELLREDRSWHPFFNKIYKNNALQAIRMPKAETGFALSASHLYLTEGFRSVAIALDGYGVPAANQSVDVAVALTTEKGWFAAEGKLSVKTCPPPTDYEWKEEICTTTFRTRLRQTSVSAVITFSLEADAPAIVPYLPKVHGGNFQTADPMVKILLIHDDKKPFEYAAFENMVVQGVSVSVRVGISNVDKAVIPAGIKNLAVSNDFGPVDTSKPFQPFGPAPKKGASLIIGHKEIFQKSKVLVRLRIGWKAVEQALTEIHALTPAESWKFLDRGNMDALPDFTIPPEARSPVDYTPNEWYRADDVSGFFKLTLQEDLKHSTYQEELIKHLTDPTTNPDYPETPVTPEIEYIGLSYTAKSEPVQIGSANAAITDDARFFHLTPFGHAEQHARLNGGQPVYLLPQFRHTDAQKTVKRHEAEFYIGLAGLRPPQNLALLFQVADGTADPLVAKPNPHLHWSYLRQNEWIPFDKYSVDDQTGELTRSGIVTLAFPRDASDGSTLLPAGMHWIRIAAAEKSESVCRLITVAAQALQATFTDRGNDPAFAAQLLPAGTISKLDEPDAAVKKIAQPFATFGGRGQEAPEAFYIRVSERLRHKDRAVALWDYERLVLEAFPQIYKVKCLNHTEYEPSEDGQGIYRELAAGHVTIVAVPNQQFQNLRDPLRPYTSLGVLLEIEQFLRKRLSCFARLHVKNPRFEPVRTQFRVRFFPGYDETWYTNQLRQEITRFLSPWAFPGGGNPSFGGKIYKSTLINFIEERPYVDYVTDFKLFHHITDFDGKDRRGIDRNEVEASTAVSILVSVPSDATPVKETHEIDIIKEQETPASGEKCGCS